MGSYKLSEDAKADLTRIHQHGIRRYGETQGDKYYYALFDRFEQMPSSRCCTKRSMSAAKVTDAACAV